VEVTNWNKVFVYRAGNLYWNLRKRGVTKGSCAMQDNKGHYFEITYNHKRQRAHRVIWEMHYGPIPKGMQIDHMDGNPRNNYLSNLRLVTRFGNNQNKSKQKNNTSGVPGVSWSKAASKWMSVIMHNRKLIYLGIYENKDDAIKARYAAEDKYHGNYARRISRKEVV
jgi:hypothetical protein